METINKTKTNSEWDVIIIGGGASGLGTALMLPAEGTKLFWLKQ
jgi:glycerol-3-phosphate dehydrogenase